MRKKSHILLAGFIMNCMKSEDLLIHKKAFFMGSVLPDCTPSFLTRKHNLNNTFDILRNELYKVTNVDNTNNEIDSKYCKHLGIITHYIADYFTFPHNSSFSGNLKEHCEYEKELKYSLRAYVNAPSTNYFRINKTFNTVDEICEFIQKMHQSYLKAANGLKADCRYIVELCFRVVDAVLRIFELNVNRQSTLQGTAA